MNEPNDLARRPDLAQLAKNNIRNRAGLVKLTPYSVSPLTNTSFPLFPLTNGATSSNLPVSLSRSTLSPSSATLFLYSLVVFFHRLSNSVVSVSCARTISSLTLICTGASTVHRNRVPMLTPHAPKHSAAASPCPSAKPPLAMKGVFRVCRALLRRIKFVMSLSPTWPAHSKPSMLRKSTPSLTALCAWRMVVHLCSTVTPASFNNLITGPGEFPAVSTIRTPSSITALA